MLIVYIEKSVHKAAYTRVQYVLAHIWVQHFALKIQEKVLHSNVRKFVVCTLIYGPSNFQHLQKKRFVYFMLSS